MVYIDILKQLPSESSCARFHFASKHAQTKLTHPLQHDLPRTNKLQPWKDPPCY